MPCNIWNLDLLEEEHLIKPASSPLLSCPEAAPGRQGRRGAKRGHVVYRDFFLVLFHRRSPSRPTDDRPDFCDFSPPSSPPSIPIDQSSVRHSHRELCTPRIMLVLVPRRASPRSTTGCITAVRMRHLCTLCLRPTQIHRRTSFRPSQGPNPLWESKS